jgi:hypothetical protein
MEFCGKFLSKWNVLGITFGQLLARIAEYLLNGSPREVKFHIAAPLPHIVCHPLVLNCPLLPLLLYFLPPACLALSTPPSCRVIHCLLTTYKLYLDMIIAFILLSLPLLPCQLSQRLLNQSDSLLSGPARGSDSCKENKRHNNFYSYQKNCVVLF